MKSIVNEYVKMFKENRRARRKMLGIISVLALLVAFGVFWNLHFTGIALTGEVYYCGVEEHQHDESCYAWVLTENADAESEPVDEESQESEASSDENAEQDAETETANEIAQISGAVEKSVLAATVDSDSDADLPEQVLVSEATESDEWYLAHGYVKVLVCGKEEHTHTAECLINENADLETAEDWEATLPEGLDGTAAENLVAVAESQLGYIESTANFTFADDGETHKGYTRYGAWYGNAYGDWDAMFVAFCLHYAGISEEDFPVNSGAYAWTVQLTNANLYASADAYTPNAGDLIFLDTDVDGKADLVGIVESLTENGTSAAIILGNCLDEEASADAVCSAEYTLDDEMIAGYGMLPDVEVNPPVINVGKSTETTLEEQTLTVTVDDLTVTLSGQLPVDATVSAESVDLELEGKNVQFALEISIYDAEGNPFEPEDDTITVTVESENITEDCTIYYLPDEGDPEEITSKSGDGTVFFDAEHFSTYFGASDDTTLYDTYMATIAEYKEQAYALEKGDDASAVALTSDLGDLLDTAYDDFSAGNLTEDQYTEIDSAINAVWDYLEENFDLYGTSTTELVSGNGNTWTTIGSSTDVIDRSTKLTLSDSNVEVSPTSSRLHYRASTNTEYGDHFITMTVSKNGITRQQYVTGDQDNDYILFKNAGTYNGESIDVKMTLVRINFSSAVDPDDPDETNQAYIDAANNYEGEIRFMILDSGGIVIGNMSSNNISDGYAYPCEMYVYVRFEIIYSNSGEGINRNFLFVSADLDGYTGARNWEEGIQTIDGFNGQFYGYADNTCRLTNISKGQVLVEAHVHTGTVNYTGNDEIVLGGFYAETSSDWCDVIYETSTSWASSVEIYLPTRTITVEKEDASNSSVKLSDAEFYLYKIESGVYKYYTSDEKWDSDISKAQTYKTSASGTLTISGLYDGTYYLKEKTAPTGYALLSSDVEFTLSLGGTLTVGSGSSSVAYADASNSLKLHVKNPTKTYDVDVLKVSSEDSTTPLQGVTFKLSRTVGTTTTYYYNNGSGTDWLNSIDSASTLTTGNDGKFTLEDLLPGSTYTYTLTETGTIDGYTIMSYNIVFTLDDNGNVTLTSNASGYASVVSGDVDTIKVKNDPTYDITVLKVNADDDSVTLADAKFILSKDDSGTTKYYVYSNGTVSWVTSKTDATLVTGDDGTFTIYDLELGDYTLTETNAPAGYLVLDDAIEFTVSLSGDHVIVDSSIDYTSVKFENNVISLTIENKVGYELPFTGGGGTFIYTVTGLMLLTGAAWLMYRQKRERKERIAG